MKLHLRNIKISKSLTRATYEVYGEIFQEELKDNNLTEENLAEIAMNIYPKQLKLEFENISLNLK